MHVLFSNMNNLGQSCALLLNNPERMLTVSVTEMHILRTETEKVLVCVIHVLRNRCYRLVLVGMYVFSISVE